MEIKYVDGKSVETDKLPDVDAILMEECDKLQKLFAQYNRQIFLVGEVKGSVDAKHQSCVFFHVMPLNKEDPKIVDQEAYRTASSKYWGRTDYYIRQMSSHQLGIGIIPPPQVQPPNQ